MDLSILNPELSDFPVPPKHGPECLCHLNVTTGEVVYDMCWHCPACGEPTGEQGHPCKLIPPPCDTV